MDAPPLIGEPGHGELLRRYLAGEHEGVWRDIRALGPLRDDARDEVDEVARATMDRAAAAFDLLAERLGARGWTRPIFGALRHAPRRDDAPVIAALEAIAGGPLPPTLKAFWAGVGGVDLTWDHEADEDMPDLGLDLPLEEGDPLCVVPARELGHLLDLWPEAIASAEAAGEPPDLVVDLGPDHWSKGGYGGGGPYGVTAPDARADPPLHWSGPPCSFTDHLRLSARWGGFPGLAAHAGREDARAFRAALAAGLEPF